MSWPTTASSNALSAASRRAGSLPTNIRSRMSTASEVGCVDLRFVPRGVLLIAFSPLDHPLDVARGHFLLLRQTVRDHGDVLSMEEVKKPVVHLPHLGPEFIDAAG